MPWSDDTRCLFCDGKLPLYRKLAQGQFCCKAHQEAYWKEQEQLAVQVLHRTHDTLRAYKPAEPVETILGPEPTPAPTLPIARPSEDFVGMPELQGLTRQRGLDLPFPPAQTTIIAADPVEYEAQWRTAKPRVALEGLAMPRLAGMAELARLTIAEAAPPEAFPAAASDAILDVPFRIATPGLAPAAFADLTLRGPVALPGLDTGKTPEWETHAQPVEFHIEPLRETGYRLTPQGGILEQIELEAFPQGERLVPLGSPRAVAASAPVRDGSAPLEFAAQPAVRPTGVDIPGTSHSLQSAGRLLPLPERGEARDMVRSVAGTAEAVEARRQPEFGHLGLAPASRDPEQAGLVALTGQLQAREARAGSAHAPALYQAFPREVAPRMPDPSVRPVTVPFLEIRHFADNVLPLDVASRIQPRAALRLRPGFLPEPASGQVLHPKARLAPVAPRHSASGLLAGDGCALNGGAHGLQRMAAGAVQFWNHAPRDLKILLFLVPLALGLAFHPSLPKVSVKASQPDTQEVTGRFQQVLDTQMTNLRKAIADRAAVGLDENFRQGLDNWMSNSGSVAEWSFDQAGFVQPVRVALYQPSLGLTDYEFQFLGAIDKGALSWVARAADFQNYYVVKLVILKGGPIPQLGITRYAVINGKPVDRVDTPVALNTRTDSLYRVAMEIQGDHYSLAIQGQMIDSWTESRLKRGGVGFFTNRGEQSRIGWVQITHQYDMLGRLFAYLAP